MELAHTDLEDVFVRVMQQEHGADASLQGGRQ
jgi:hypothetical protein